MNTTVEPGLSLHSAAGRPGEELRMKGGSLPMPTRWAADYTLTGQATNLDRADVALILGGDTIELNRLEDLRSA